MAIPNTEILTTMAKNSLGPCSTNILEEFSESKASTENLLTSHIYTWKIKNFSYSFYNLNEKSLSPSFSVGSNTNKSKWRLTLIPNYETQDDEIPENLFGIFCGLEIIACDMNELQAEYKIHVVNSKGEMINKSSWCGAHLFKKGERHQIFLETQDKAIDHKHELLHKELTIVCQIIYKIGSENNKQEGLPTLPSTPAMDFTFLLENKHLSDVTLCVRGREFSAHKAILSARSSVFRAMFQSDMEESRNNRVELTDIDEEGLRGMLCYIYTGKMKELEEMATQLLGISEKYDLEDLKIRCEEALMKSLSLENVVERFILSDTFRATNLNIQVKKFIKAHVSVIVIRPEFKTMVRTHPHLGIETCYINSIGYDTPSFLQPSSSNE